VLFKEQNPESFIVITRPGRCDAGGSVITFEPSETSTRTRLVVELISDILSSVYVLNLKLKKIGPLILDWAYKLVIHLIKSEQP
jgi:hypothetical protein